MRTRRAQTATDSLPRSDVTPDNPAEPLRETATDEFAACSRIFVLNEGLYAAEVGELSPQESGKAGIDLPAIHVSAPPSEEYDTVEIATTSGDVPNWFGAKGGVAIVRSPAGGGVLLVTAYGPPAATAALKVDIRRLDRSASESRYAPPPAVPLPAERSIASEIVLHIEREGDRRFPAEGWVGNRGRRLRVEAFAIRPLEGLSTGDIEYKAFGPNGRETPWVSDAKLCGTRGRGLPLTGFAVRIAPHLRDRFEVVYEGAFFNSGVAGPHRDGEPCMPSVFDDPLEAINLRVIERAAR